MEMAARSSYIMTWTEAITHMQRLCWIESIAVTYEAKYQLWQAKNFTARARTGARTTALDAMQTAL
jgi:hypothetical protein